MISEMPLREDIVVMNMTHQVGDLRAVSNPIS